jgi:hypothetical protein
MRKLREEIAESLKHNKEKFETIEKKHQEINRMISYFEKISKIIESC